MLKRTLLPRLASLALLFTLVLTGCGAPPPANTNAPSTNVSGAQIIATPAPVLTDLHEPDELKAQFNKDSGMPRVILLVSPTCGCFAASTRPTCVCMWPPMKRCSTPSS